MTKEDILRYVAKTPHNTNPNMIGNMIDALVEGEEPTGNIEITENGENINVAQYATATVAVPGVTPTGELNITANETYDVTNYASAVVNVPTGIIPTGTKNITANGTVDVTNYASVSVSVPSPTLSTITIQNNLSNGITVAGLSYEYVKPDGGSQTQSLISQSGYNVTAGKSVAVKGWFWFNNFFVRSVQGIIRITGKGVDTAAFVPSVASVTVTALGSNYYFINSTSANMIDSVTIEINPAS